MRILNELEKYLPENYDYVSPDEIDDFEPDGIQLEFWDSDND